MLNKVNRIQKSGDFNKIFRQSRPVQSGKITIRAIAGNQEKPSRFGFIISNKIDKRATRRNSLKRRLRSIAREILPQIKKGNSIIVLVRENFSTPYNFQEIRQTFIEGIGKAGLLQNEKDTNKNN